MNPNDVRHNAVNWEFGMLVAPAHFLRQERFYEASMLWTLRYAHNGFGLIGGGPRLPESEFGAVRHDPVIAISEDEHTLRISISQCRGLSAAGTPVEIGADHPLHSEFNKADLEGVGQARIYIVATPHAYTALDGPCDEFNPQIQSERIRAYRITLQPHGDEAEHAIAVALLRRSESSNTYERDPNFIPPCTNLTAYSELTTAWRRILEQLTALSGRFIELHRAMQEYIELTRERGIDVALDRDTLEFVKRMIPSIEACLSSCLDPVQSPTHFFNNLRMFVQGAAVNLDLSPPVQQYFDALRNAGETEFVPLLSKQRQMLKSPRRWRVEDDLGVEVRWSQSSLENLRMLERALEGKYIDFRVSPALESLNFLFDRGGSALYKLAAKPARLQGFGDEMTFHFAGIRLEGRERYRIIVSAETGHEYVADTRVPLEIRINEGSGLGRTPIHGIAQVHCDGQRNVEFDFEAPDVATVTDLRVSVPAHCNVKTALLFTRHRFYADQAQGEKLPTDEMDATLRPSGRAKRREDVGLVNHGSAPARPFRPPLQPESFRSQTPWSTRESQEPSRPNDSQAAAPRRRRLE